MNRVIAVRTSESRFSDGVIQAGILIAVVVVPLYFNVLTYHVFEPDKVTLLRSVILLVMGVWIARKLTASTFPSVSHLRASVLRLPTSLLPVFFLLVTAIIGTVASVLPRVSLWGSYGRRQGLYTLTTYLALFFLTYENARHPKVRRRIVHAILLTSVPVSVYAILQHYGLDLLQWQTMGTVVTTRAISTLGNPIFLGAYLIMVIPLTLAQLASSVEGVRARVRASNVSVALYSVLLILQVAALFFTQSRGPILGLLGGLVFGSLAWSARHRGRRAWLAGVAILALIVAVIGVGRLSGLGRLTMLVNVTSRTAQQRLLVWQAVMDLLKTDPFRALVGYGPETLRGALLPHLPAALAGLAPDQDFDRAHNLMLDTWASTGLLGVLAWLAVITAVVYHGLRALNIIDRSRRRSYVMLAAMGAVLGVVVPWVMGKQAWVGVGLVAGLLGGLGAYLVLQTFHRNPAGGRQSGHELAEAIDVAVEVREGDRETASASGSAKAMDHGILLALLIGVVAHVTETMVGIPTVATQVLFWVYAALLVAVPSSGTTSSRQLKDEGRGTADVSAWGLTTGMALTLPAFPILAGATPGLMQGVVLWGVLVTTTLLFGTLLLWTASSDLHDSEIYRYLMFASGTVFAFLLLARMPLPPLDQTHSTVSLFLYVIVAVVILGLILCDWRPSIPSVWRPGWPAVAAYGLMTVVTVAGIWLTNVVPLRADVNYKQGQGLARSGGQEWNQALAAFRRSVALAPFEDRYHSGLGAMYVQLAHREAEVAERLRWLSLAETSLRQAHRLDPYRADHLRNLGLLYHTWATLGPDQERLSRLRQALRYYERGARRHPISIRIWREWGTVYADLGEWDAAVQRYEESLHLNDDFVETWMLLAKARLHQSDYERALQAYVRAVALDGAQVLRTHRAAVASTPDDPLLRQALALVYAAQGQHQAALDEADAARALLHDVPASWAEFLEVLQSQ